MNLKTVLMCAQTTARHQIAALGAVDSDVQALIDELDAPPVEKTPVVRAKRTKPPVEAPAEAPVAEAPVDAPAEAAPVEALAE
jgi:hypothetical protein